MCVRVCHLLGSYVAFSVVYSTINVTTTGAMAHMSTSMYVCTCMHARMYACSLGLHSASVGFGLALTLFERGLSEMPPAVRFHQSL